MNVTGLTVGERLLILRALANLRPADQLEADYRRSLVNEFCEDLRELLSTRSLMEAVAKL